MDQGFTVEYKYSRSSIHPKRLKVLDLQPILL